MRLKPLNKVFELQIQIFLSFKLSANSFWFKSRPINWHSLKTLRHTDIKELITIAKFDSA